MSYQVRRMADEDLEQVLKLESECFIDAWNKDQWLYELHNNPVNVILVLVDDDKIIGFNNYMITFNSATISQIAISKDYRRQGLAKRLLKEMEDTFIKEGDDMVETVTLEVRQSNEAALSLYKNDGYEVITTKRHYYKDGEDAIYMVKRLI